MSGKMPDKGNQISVLMATNLKLAAFMFKTMECCSKAYDIKHVDSTSVLKYQYQWKWNRRKQITLRHQKMIRTIW